MHRYEIRRDGQRCELHYTLRVMRLSRRPWWTKGWARGVAQKISASYARGGLTNLIRMAEAQAGTNAAG